MREADEIDRREDELCGDARRDESPEQLRTAEGRNQALQEAKRRLAEHKARAAEADGDEQPSDAIAEVELNPERFVTRSWGRRNWLREARHELDQAPERVQMRRIPNVKRDTLTEFVLDHVARGSEVRTDAWSGYDDVGRYRFKHVVVNVSATGDPALLALPHVHLVASLVKRWVLGTHQGAISHAKLDNYLDEFTFRFNRRRARHRGLLFYRLLEGALAADPSPYKELIGESAGLTSPRAESGERSGYPVPRGAGLRSPRRTSTSRC